MPSVGEQPDPSICAPSWQDRAKSQSLSWKRLSFHPLSSRALSLPTRDRSLGQLLALTLSLQEGEPRGLPTVGAWRSYGWTAPPNLDLHLFAAAWGIHLLLESLLGCPHPPIVSQLSKPRPSHTNHGLTITSLAS